MRTWTLFAATLLFLVGSTRPASAERDYGIELSLRSAPRMIAQVAQVEVLGSRDAAATERRRGWLGVYVSFEEGGALRIDQVVDGGPAYTAGLRSGDFILRINGFEADRPTFERAMDSLVPGAPMQFVVRRGEDSQPVAVRVGERPDASTLAPLLLQIELQEARDAFETRLRASVDIQAAEFPFGEVARVSTIPDSSIGGVWQSSEGGQFVFGPRGQELSITSGSDEGSGRPLTVILRSDTTNPQMVLQLTELARTREDLLRRQREIERQNLAIRAQTAAEFERVSDMEARVRALQEVTEGATTFEVRGEGATWTVTRPLAPYVSGLTRVAGAEMRRVNADLAPYFGVTSGLLVTEVPEGTPAQSAGLRAGDVIIEADGFAVNTVDELRDRFAVEAREHRVVVVRQGRQLLVRFR